MAIDASTATHEADREAAAVAVRPSTRASRQAIILVHGMGEQIPMDTIKSFAKIAWRNGVHIHGGTDADEIWSKPDPKTGSLELRRLTTRKTMAGGAYPHGVRADFYELYWADLTAGSTWQQFVTWTRYLLFRPFSKVPPPVRAAWVCLWLLSLLAFAIAVAVVLPQSIWAMFAPDWVRPIAVAVVAALTASIHQMAIRSFGRVVRYTRAQPDNIAARAAVRERGLQLLRSLHESDEYNRITIVSHSLGTILAYDLINYFWAEREAARTFKVGTSCFTALQELEQAASALDAAINAARGQRDDSRLTPKQCATIRATEEYRTFRACQVELRRHMGSPDELSERWLISDLVTLGSPLTHAEFLLAQDWTDLSLRQRQREVPTSPPFRELLEPRTLGLAKSLGGFPIANPEQASRLLSFPQRRAFDDQEPLQWTLHHGAPFAVVRWTNIFDPSRFVVQGDLISGPLGATFGPAIEDIDLAAVDRRSTSFTHTKYWDEASSTLRSEVLRNALNVLDEN